VKAVVTRFATEAMQDLNRRGCLVTNTAVELAPHDDELAKQVQTSWAYLETLLTATLTRARAQGELAPSAEPRALARTLLVFMQGIRVVGKAAATPEVIDDATKHVLTLLA
jgi:TetR/AcrR family transcriptional repressor of nem operon